MTRIGLLGVASLLAACASAGVGGSFQEPFELDDHQWVRVFENDRFIVSVDTTHVSSGPVEDSVEVWYQTRHLTMREDDGRPWNREVIRSQLRCDPVSFRTVLITVFLEDGPPVAQQGPTPIELASLEWRRVAAGSVDAGSLEATCSVLRRAGLLG